VRHHNAEVDMDDRSDIANVVGALAVHVDGLRWDDLLALFTAEVRVDYTSLFGGEAQWMTREALIEGWRNLLPGFTRTCHVIGVPVVTVDGDAAQAAASVVAWHFVKETEFAGRDQWLVGGSYEMTFRKLDDGWRLASLTLAGAWAEGNLELPKIAGERVAQSRTRQ
jgi:hypothetical protein